MLSSEKEDESETTDPGRVRRSLTIHQNNKVVNTIIEKEDESETIDQGRTGEWCAKFFQDVCEDQ